MASHPSVRPSGRHTARIAIPGLALIAVAIASDFVVRSFWVRHAMLTSLLASLIVVVISVAVINELIEARNRRRWHLLAQSVLFALVQSARWTWTTMLEVLHLNEVQTGALEALRAGAQVDLDVGQLSAAVTDLLADDQRRQRFQRTVERLSEHAGQVIAARAGVMVGAAPYAGLLDRHVELQGRLEWVSSVLAHREPAPDRTWSRQQLTLSSVATEQADSFDDQWMRDMIVAITVLAARLDSESRELAFSLVSNDWWNERTREIVAPRDPGDVGAGTAAAR
jgi:hypothetical protein